MNYLLDTHLLLWSAFGDRRLPKRARKIILSQDHDLWFSVASIWEVAIKQASGRRDFDVDPGALRTGLLKAGYRELDIRGPHVLTVRLLPTIHRDPFDRILVAQAHAEGLSLLTADATLQVYGSPVVLV